MTPDDRHIWERLKLLGLDIPSLERESHSYPLRPLETWHQDPADADLWHGAAGVILNSAALQERESYFEVVRVRTTAALDGHR